MGWQEEEEIDWKQANPGKHWQKVLGQLLLCKVSNQNKVKQEYVSIWEGHFYGGNLKNNNKKPNSFKPVGKYSLPPFEVLELCGKINRRKRKSG